MHDADGRRQGQGNDVIATTKRDPHSAQTGRCEGDMSKQAIYDNVDTWRRELYVDGDLVGWIRFDLLRLLPELRYPWAGGDFIGERKALPGLIERKLNPERERAP
jgi:hypothetical protein